MTLMLLSALRIYDSSCYPGVPQVKPVGSAVPKGLTPPLDPSDPFADDEKERREVEELARKFESKYVSSKVNSGLFA